LPGRELLFLAFLLAGCGEQEPASALPNIVLVSYDGVRADRTGCYGAATSTTPTLDRFASEGIRFQWAFSQSNESLYSHSSMFTGRFVPEVAVPDYLTYALPPSALLISEVLGNYGYTSGAFVAGAHLRAEYGFDQGFSVYDDRHDFGTMFSKSVEALDWIDRQAKQPFFVVLQAYDAHRPYLKAGPWFHVFGSTYRGPSDDMLKRRFSVDQVYEGVYHPGFPIRVMAHNVGAAFTDPRAALRIRALADDTAKAIPLSAEDVDHVRTHYDTGILSEDIYVGRFLEGLEQRGLLENTFVILTADHGEDLQDHGYFDHRSVVRDSTTQVPLVLWGRPVPREARGTVRTDVAQSIDLVPTIAAAAGAVRPGGVRGRDLLGEVSPIEGPVFQMGVLSELSVRTRTHRLLFVGVPPAFPYLEFAIEMAPLRAPFFELYDHRTDPLERTNVVESEPAMAGQLRDALLDWYRSLPRSTEKGHRPENDALMEVLRSKGYW